MGTLSEVAARSLAAPTRTLRARATQIGRYRRKQSRMTTAVSRKQDKCPVWEGHARRAAPWAGRGARLALRFTLRIIELPTQYVLIFPGDNGGAVHRTQRQETRAHAAGPG